MKAILLALCAVLAVTSARVVLNADGLGSHHLLGGKECTWGPSYWCQNITTAAGCNAMKHCIKKEWESKEVPADSDSVCDICKDMVTQARDQLESNQTQEDLKAVFEGSCALMQIKEVVKYCDKLVDQFIPELVETLASQMNPSVVCSVAGLCNSAHIDELLLNYHKMMSEGVVIVPKSLAKDELEPDECSKCYTIATHMEHKLSGTSRDQVLENILTLCGRVSSFSDACSSIVLTHFETIYAHLSSNFNAENICHLSGQCSAKFHKHEDETIEAVEVEVRPLSSVGMVEIGDDLPCELCEQLVGHLRDLLVANTTEVEFETVLEGMCKQTGSFSTECKAVVDQYYPEIYEYLTKELNGEAVCSMAGICPSPDKSAFNGPIWPLLPEKPAEIGGKIMSEKKHTKTEADEMQLPLERMVGPSSGLLLLNGGVEGAQECALCEYLLHYLQEAITNPKTEDEVKQEVEKMCTILPTSIRPDCQHFVETYGDAVVAILAQEIDPSIVCPKMHICPSKDLIDAWESLPKEMVLTSEVDEKPNCPLCLLAVEQLRKMIKDNKTEVNIEAALEKLCIHLPNNLKDQCTNLVKAYSKELVEMMVNDFTSQEVCVFLKLCDNTESPTPNFFPTDKNGEILTNEIPYFPLTPVVKEREEVADGGKCVVCEYVVETIESKITTNATEDEIEQFVKNVCHILPKTVSRQCEDFVTQYADVVIQMLVNRADPKTICTDLHLCKENIKQIEESVAECALCQVVISRIDKMLEDPKVDHDIENVVSKICKYVPARNHDKCTEMIQIYGQSIINLLTSLTDSKEICRKLALCAQQDYLAMSMTSPRIKRSTNLGTKPCTWGPSYWCVNDANAAECRAENHCKTHVWNAESAAAAKEAKTAKVQPGS